MSLKSSYVYLFVPADLDGLEDLEVPVVLVLMNVPLVPDLHVLLVVQPDLQVRDDQDSHGVL